MRAGGADESPPDSSELTGRTRASVLTTVLLVVLMLAAWAHVLRSPMGMDDMAGMEMAMRPTFANGLAYVTAWSVMMTAMMLPSASPLVLLYAGALRGSGDAGVVGKTYALAGGYLLVWVLYSAAATALQRLLSHLLVLTPMMETATPLATAVLLAVAGLYQLTPAKRACLTVCRSPLSYLVLHWPNRTAAAFRLGVRHGIYCVGCCWALMLLLFAGGVMNLAVIVGLSLWVLVEKLLPFGERTAQVSGWVLLALGAWVAYG